MDTFTTITAFVAVAFIYMGEQFRQGFYFTLAAMFWILLAWRMAEEVWYMASAAVILILIIRTFWRSEDVRDSRENEEE